MGISWLAKNSQAGEVEDTLEWNRSTEMPQNGGYLIKLEKTKDIVTRIFSLIEKVKDLIIEKQEIVKVIDEVAEICDIYELPGLVTHDCPTLLAFKEVFNEQASANTVNTIPQLVNNTYSLSYNLGLQNHSKRQWK